jgi:hypothetical protein
LVALEGLAAVRIESGTDDAQLEQAVGLREQLADERGLRGPQAAGPVARESPTVSA